jgi:catechol 2,3-dioxygenase-like lactoylglutathione lyase family enzyme
MAEPPDMILESALYAEDLDAAEAFYGGVLGLERIARGGRRHVFFRCGAGVLLLFDPRETAVADPSAPLPVPPHGARGPGHLCFRAEPLGIEAWRERLEAAGVAIEAVVDWPGGGRSVYLRDPAGNSLEFAEARIWARGR